MSRTLADLIFLAGIAGVLLGVAGRRHGLTVLSLAVLTAGALAGATGLR